MARREFSQKTKLAAWQRAAGCCENCGVKIRPGNGPEYHHKQECYFDGDNDLDNCEMLCVPCHGVKTRDQAPVIAKSRRLRKKEAGIKKPSRFHRPAGYKYDWQLGRYVKA